MDEIGVVLDMDGVILDSEGIKMTAFGDLFAGFPDKGGEIDRFNKENQGLPRREKIGRLYNEVLGLSVGEEELEGLARLYGELVWKRLENVPLAPGLKGFLRRAPFQFFVSSAAPAEEVRVLLEEKRILDFFDSVHGYPSRKSTVLERLVIRFGEGKVVFFGDSPNDWDAAQKAGAHFVGVRLGEITPFLDGLDVPIIRDFSDHSALIRLIQALCKPNTRSPGIRPSGSCNRSRAI